MGFKLFNIEFYFSYFWFCFLALIFITDKTGLAYLIFLAAFLHEAGHLIAMCLLKSKPKSIKFGLGSINIYGNVSFCDFHDFLIEFSGPLLNFIFFLGFLLIFKIVKYKILIYFSAVNLIFCCFNLLPVLNLDGGDILKFILNKFLSVRICDIILKTLTVLILTAFIFYGFYACFKSSNYGIVITGIYLLIIAVLTENKKKR